MLEPTWISLLPPLLAIALAIGTRQVYLSLAAGVWLGTSLIAGGALAGLGDAIEALVTVLASAGNTRAILFTLVIGALIATMEASLGVRGFVTWLERRRWIDGPIRAQALAWAVGLVIFIESNITVLVAGALARPLFDRYRVSREKLAYLIDSTSAPICMLIPLNAWGAYCLGLLGQLGVNDPMAVFVASIPLNFYGLAAVLLAAVTVFLPFDLGPMKRAQARTAEGELLWPGAQPLVDTSLGAVFEAERGAASEAITPRAVNMLLPVLTMVVMMPLSLYITGKGVLAKGSGSTSVLWSVLAALAVCWALLLVQRAFSVEALTRVALEGAGGLLPLATILLLALALGNVTKSLGTGRYVAQLTAGSLPPVAFLPLVFVVAAGVAFSTGTSWGTFAIMLPIAVPVAASLGLSPAPFVAASLSGGVFGDHASPISDTTIVSSMAAATDHIDHVRTQLPYALIAGAVAAIAFAITGAVL
ncbi:MAG: C4-dicarboxylate ABC transporter [Proteobacteria bacterium]|nr:MAG: C4-dicarboxylate ABC transporter [Pseudomonadota bacterium]